MAASSLIVRDIKRKTAFDGAGAGSAGWGQSLRLADGLGIMPVRRVFGLLGASCTGAGEDVRTIRLHPVIPGSAGPGRGGRQLPPIRSGAPKGEGSS